VTLTEAGMEKLEGRLRDAGELKGESLYASENVSVVHHVIRRCAPTSCSSATGLHRAQRRGRHHRRIHGR